MFPEQIFTLQTSMCYIWQVTYEIQVSVFESWSATDFKSASRLHNGTYSTANKDLLWKHHTGVFTSNYTQVQKKKRVPQRLEVES